MSVLQFLSNANRHGPLQIANPTECDNPWAPPELQMPPKELSKPMKLAILHRHRMQPSMNHRHQQCHKPSWVSRDDASNKGTTPVAPSLLIQSWSSNDDMIFT
jgi:hypothetical protein